MKHQHIWIWCEPLEATQQQLWIWFQTIWGNNGGKRKQLFSDESFTVSLKNINLCLTCWNPFHALICIFVFGSLSFSAYPNPSVPSSCKFRWIRQQDRRNKLLLVSRLRTYLHQHVSLQPLCIKEPFIAVLCDWGLCYWWRSMMEALAQLMNWFGKRAVEHCFVNLHINRFNQDFSSGKEKSPSGETVR